MILPKIEAKVAAIFDSFNSANLWIYNGNVCTLGSNDIPSCKIFYKWRACGAYNSEVQKLTLPNLLKTLFYKYIVFLFRMNLWPFLSSLLGGFTVALLLHPPKSGDKSVQLIRGGLSGKEILPKEHSYMTSDFWVGR